MGGGRIPPEEGIDRCGPPPPYGCCDGGGG